MPANIATDAKGRVMAVYADKPAWHGLGTVVTGAMTAEQVIKRANLGWVVDKAPAFAKVGGRFVAAPDHVALVRKDTRQVFSFASPDYTVLQNVDGARTLEAVVSQRDAKGHREAAFVSAAALGNGATVFACLELARFRKVAIKRDPSRTEGFLFGTWAHDGSSALRIGLYMNRIECQNLLNAGLAHSERHGLLVRIVHTGDLRDRLADARRILGFVDQEAQAYVETMNALADTPIPSPTKRWLDSFLERLVPIPEDMERPMARRDAREAIAGLYLHGRSLEGIPQSAYRVLNAVTTYADHERPLRVSDPSLVPERRFRSATEGPGADLKARALDLLRQEFELTPTKVLVPAGRASGN